MDIAVMYTNNVNVLQKINLCQIYKKLIYPFELIDFQDIYKKERTKLILRIVNSNGMLNLQILSYPVINRGVYGEDLFIGLNVTQSTTMMILTFTK